MQKIGLLARSKGDVVSCFRQSSYVAVRHWLYGMGTFTLILFFPEFISA
jgi:hypothetical protein